MEKKKPGRPKKENGTKIVALSLRLTEEERNNLRLATKKLKSNSDTDTIRRLVQTFLDL
jgi:hypothetical protein